MGRDWTVASEPGTDDSGEWSTTDELGGEDASEWKMWLNSSAVANITSALGVGEAVEDLDIAPEDMTLEPENIQDDNDGWTVEPEAD